MKKFLFAFVIVFSVSLLFVSVTIFAEEEEVEFVEPIIFEEPYPNDVGEWDLRMSIEYARNDDEDINLWKTPRGQLFFGILDRFGGSIDFPYLIREEGEEQASGIGDFNIGIKYLVLEHKENVPAIILGMEITFPTADEDEELGEGKYEYMPYIGFLKQFGTLVLQGIIGYSFERNGENEESLEYAASLAMPFASKYYLFGELKGSNNFDEDEQEFYLSPGFKWNIRENIFVAIGVPIGLTDESDDYQVVSQVQIGW